MTRPRFVTAKFVKGDRLPWQVWSADEARVLAAFSSERLFQHSLEEIIQGEASRAGYSLPPKDEAASEDVLAERERQKAVEGWTEDHDDSHAVGELALAAGCYALHAGRPQNQRAVPPAEAWPWAESWWKPSDRRRDLVKAGALILAEIERMDRASKLPVAE